MPAFCSSDYGAQDDKICNSSIQFYSPGGLLRLLLRSFAAMVCKDQEDPAAAGPRLPPCLRGVV
jgi:hypothetical protein